MGRPRRPYHRWLLPHQPGTHSSAGGLGPRVALNLILNCVQWYIDNPFKLRDSGDADGIFFQGAQGILKDIFHGA